MVTLNMAVYTLLKRNITRTNHRWKHQNHPTQNSKSKEEQQNRTRKSAEVFTPSWICNDMNNLCDDEWLGYTNAFNTKQEHYWLTNLEKSTFQERKLGKNMLIPNGWKSPVEKLLFSHLVMTPPLEKYWLLINVSALLTVNCVWFVKIQTMKQIGLNGQKEHMRQPMVMNFKEITCS